MSLLSQFFPSGGNVTKIEFLLTAGGGGGGAAWKDGYYGYTRSHGGGGGGGQIVIGNEYEVTPGVSYSITVGAGGAGGCKVPVPSPYYCNMSTPGLSGGNSTFGAITAYGGGGGGTWVQPGYIPTITPTRPGFSNSIGGNGGTGGGAGADGYNFPLSGTMNGTGGAASSSYPIGNTVRVGSPGSPNSAPLATNPTPQLTSQTIVRCYSTLGGGGGGNYHSSSSGGGSVSLSGSNVVLIPGPSAPAPYCFGTVAYSRFNGTVSGSGGTPINASKFNAPWINHVAGGDGFLSNISGTDQYYGGGGAGSQTLNAAFNVARLSPSSPCYTPVAPQHARHTTPLGGLGGGGYVMYTGSSFQPIGGSPVIYPWIFPIVNDDLRYIAGAVSTYAVCGSTAGTGGGGLGGAYWGYNNASPSPSYQIADGQNGASGVFFVRYPTNYAAATVSGNTPTPAQPGYYVYKWTSPGSITFN